MPFRFRVSGEVTEQESGRPLRGLHVQVFDHHWLHDDPLGGACTDAEGRFQIQFTDLKFKVPFEVWPDLWLNVLDPEGQRVLSSTRHAVRKRARVEERYEIAIPRSTLGVELAQGADALN
jgi:hypothetical protein